MKKYLYLIEKNKEIIKYFISGSTAASVDIGFLYILVDVLEYWYLSASIFAFIVAFIISFSLQKFWTFRDNNLEQIKKQLLLYFIVAIINLGFNTIILYTLVDQFNLWHIYSQVIACMFLAIISFVVYKFKIFNQQPITNKEILSKDPINGQ